jgi:hypothetical protein
MDSRKISFIVIYKYRKISHVFPSLTLEEAEYFCKPSCVDPFDSSDEKYDSISDNEELIEDEARFCEAVSINTNIFVLTIILYNRIINYYYRKTRATRRRRRQQWKK